MEELYLDGNRIYLEDNTVSLTKQINDLAEIKDRQSHYSNRIKIPKTGLNISVLGNLGIIGSTSTKPYTTVTAKYIYDGFELISNGTAVILRTSDFFEVVVYDGNRSLLETLKGLKIKSLTWTTHNHSLTVANYTGSFSNTSGYIYAFADFYDGKDTFNIDRQSPSLFVHTLWDMIFVQNGLTYSGSFFSETDFKSRIFTPRIGFENTIVTGTSATVVNTTPSGSIISSDSSEITSNDVISSGTFATDNNYRIEFIGSMIITYGVDVYINFKTNGNSVWRSGIYALGTVDLTGGTSGSVDSITVNGVNIMSGVENYTGSLTVTASNIVNNINANNTIPNYHASSSGTVITISSTNIGENGFIVDVNSTTITTTKTDMSISATSFNDFINLYQKSGDTWSLEIHTVSEFISGTGFFEVDVDYTFTKFKQTKFTRSISVDFSTLFDNETQMGFIKDTMQHFGLIMNKTGDNSYEFKKISSLLTGSANAEDWSDKFSKLVSQSYKPNYAQNNYARFEYDDDDSNVEKSFANGNMVISNTNINVDKDLFTSIYKAPDFADGSAKYRKIKMWELGNDNVIVAFNSGIHIGKKTTESRSISYGWSDDISHYTETLTVPYFDLVTYQYDLNTYYAEFKTMLETYNKVTAEFKLNLLDIHNLDFLKLKYVKQLGKYFYLNKVKNFKKDRVTKVELIEI